MSEEQHGIGGGATGEGNAPRPQTIPEPTYWPVILALACVVFLLGFLTSWTLTGAGLAGCIVALGKWIGELRHDYRT